MRMDILMLPENRKRLAKLVTALFAHWQIDTATQAALLGLPSEDDLLMDELPADEDVIDRVGHLLAIHKALQILYQSKSGGVPDIVYGYMTHANKRFTPTPIDYILQQGDNGLAEVRYYLDFVRIR